MRKRFDEAGYRYTDKRTLRIVNDKTVKQVSANCKYTLKRFYQYVFIMSNGMQRARALSCPLLPVCEAIDLCRLVYRFGVSNEKDKPGTA